MNAVRGALMVALMATSFQAVAADTKTDTGNTKPATESTQPTATANPGRIERLVNKIQKKYGIGADLARRIVTAAHRTASIEKLDPIMLLSIIGVESSFNPNIRNRLGATGLTQVIPKWHPSKIAEMNRKGGNLFHPEHNIEVGAKIYSEYLRMSNNNSITALQRYNGSLRDKSRKYSNKVMREYRELSTN